jgi:hypothetical protein
MTQQKIKDYSAKYRFQWWWYSHGGKETVENAFGAVTIFFGAYVAWWLAYLLEP